MAGRHTKLNKTLLNKIVKHLKTGATVADVCRHVGITTTTYFNWIERGEAQEPQFLEFLDAVTQAQGDAKITAIATLRNAMTPYEQTQNATKTLTETRLNHKGEAYEYKRTEETKTVTLFAGDWRAAVEYLKRRAPDEWSEKHILELNLPPELLKRFVDAASAAGVSAGDALEAFVQELASASADSGTAGSTEGNS